MAPQPRILVVIPARGGSKGIPRKNLRRLGGQPLIRYCIETSTGSRFDCHVLVSSDDEEILSVAEGFGAAPLPRDAGLANDSITLDPVVYDAVIRTESALGVRFDLVVTMQPTSPLLTIASLDAAIARMLDDPGIDTLLSARLDTHLGWRREDDRFVPNYEKRVNRQELPPHYRETGGFLISRRSCVTPTGRIGPRIDLYLLPPGEDIDIDSADDWALCEARMDRRKVLLVVTGSAVLGLGHVHNALLVAADLTRHEVAFLVDDRSRLAHDEIAARHFPVRMQQSVDLVDDVLALGPDVVINDRLDTDEAYVARLKAAGLVVINFEDLGPGAGAADLVVNAIYPEAKIVAPRHYFGPAYFVLRDEFTIGPRPGVADAVRRVLLTFGGVDPNNLTRKVLAAIHPHCVEHGIELTIVAGSGYAAYVSLDGFAGVRIVRNTRNIARYMAGADLIFTSAGRTTYEVASLGVPCIVLAQNDREMTHLFATPDNGFEHLGLGADVDPAEIAARFRAIAADAGRRRDMSDRMKRTDLRGGRDRVAGLVRQAIALSRPK